MSTEAKQSMIEVLNGERCAFEDVTVVEELRKELINSMTETVQDVQKTAEEFALLMTLIDLNMVNVDDEVRMKLVNQLLQGALYGALVNEMAVQVGQIDLLIAQAKGATEESKVIDFAEKKSEKEESKVEAEAESGEELDEEVMAEVIRSMLLGAISASLKDTKEKTDGEA